MTETTKLDALRKAGRKYARAQAARDAALAELFAAIREADAEDGHRRAELVAAAGVAKQTVYDALKPRDVATGLRALGHASASTTAEQYANGAK